MGASIGSPKWGPGAAQRQRVRWGKEEKGSERSFSPQRRKRSSRTFRRRGSCQRPEPLTEGFRRAGMSASLTRGFPRGVIQSVPQGHHNRPSGRFHSVPQSKCPWGTLAEFHFATGKISPAHRADFTEGGMPPSYALQVNSVTGPQDFSSTSTSAGSEAPPLPSLFTMMVTVPVSPLPVPLWK